MLCRACRLKVPACPNSKCLFLQMAEYNEHCCESASTNLEGVCENGTEVSLEESRVNNKERGELKGKNA